MAPEDIKLVHCLARQNSNGEWEPSTTRYYHRENGSMGVIKFDNEFDAIDKERVNRKEIGRNVKEHIFVCSGTNPYSGSIGSFKYSSRVGLPSDFKIGERPILDIIKEIITKGLISEGEWLSIDCI